MSIKKGLGVPPDINNVMGNLTDQEMSSVADSVASHAARQQRTGAKSAWKAVRRVPHLLAVTKAFSSTRIVPLQQAHANGRVPAAGAAKHGITLKRFLPGGRGGKDGDADSAAGMEMHAASTTGPSISEDVTANGGFGLVRAQHQSFTRQLAFNDESNLSADDNQKQSFYNDHRTNMLAKVGTMAIFCVSAFLLIYFWWKNKKLEAWLLKKQAEERQLSASSTSATRTSTTAVFSESTHLTGAAERISSTLSTLFNSTAS